MSNFMNTYLKPLAVIFNSLPQWLSPCAFFVESSFSPFLKHFCITSDMSTFIFIIVDLLNLAICAAIGE